MIAKQSESAGHSPSTGQADKRRRVRIHHLQESKRRGEAWPMLTSYDTCSARIFDEAGIPVLLVGDSAANSVYGYESSLPVEVDELLPLTRAVTRSVEYALVVADLPFGSYQASTEQALATATRFMKEGRAHAVKLEGGRRYAAQVEALVAAGIPVMGHVGFTPQSEHRLGGYRVQARSVQAAHGSDSRLSHRCWTRICSVAPELSALLSRYVMGTQQLPSIAAVNHNSPQKSLFFGGCRLKMTEASFVFLFQEKCPTVSP